MFHCVVLIVKLSLQSAYNVVTLWYVSTRQLFFIIYFMQPLNQSMADCSVHSIMTPQFLIHVKLHLHLRRGNSSGRRA